jgi:hypothetical protein
MHSHLNDSREAKRTSHDWQRNSKNFAITQREQREKLGGLDKAEVGNACVALEISVPKLLNEVHSQIIEYFPRLFEEFRV